MRIEAGQRATVTMALRPVGEVELANGRRVPARSDSIDVAVGATVIVRSIDEHGLVVQLSGVATMNSDSSRSRPLPRSTDATVRKESEYQKKQFRELLIPLLLCSVLPGILMGLIFYSRNHEPIDAFLGTLIGMIVLPVAYVFLTFPLSGSFGGEE